MTTAELVQLTADYGLSYDEVSVAALANMLTRRGGEKQEMHTLFENLSRILQQDEIVDVVKWATWVKHANKKDLVGKTPQELIALQAKTTYA